MSLLTFELRDKQWHRSGTLNCAHKFSNKDVVTFSGTTNRTESPTIPTILPPPADFSCFGIYLVVACYGILGHALLCFSKFSWTGILIDRRGG